MSVTLHDLTTNTAYRLGDLDSRIWTSDEIALHLQNAYQQIATRYLIFFDWAYLENLPAGFTCTQPWEQKHATNLSAPVHTLGVANFTMDDERTRFADSRQAIGPARYTSAFELADGHFDRAGCDPSIPAVADVPATLTILERVTWDKRGIDGMEARRLSRVDARYEVTKGEVYGFIWQKDGIRALRKVRVPAQRAAQVQPIGSFGLLRQPSDLSGDTVSGTWGVPRRVPGHHPIGTESFGLPRRPYLESTNVRVEHGRLGRPMLDPSDVCELPDRMTEYLKAYAMAKCYERPGPGQDVALAAFFLQLWTRGLTRIERRLQLVDAEHVAVLGGDNVSLGRRPPRPRLPWAYGSVVR